MADRRERSAADDQAYWDKLLEAPVQPHATESDERFHRWPGGLRVGMRIHEPSGD